LHLSKLTAQSFKLKAISKSKFCSKSSQFVSSFVEFQKISINMKAVILAALLIASFIVVVRSDATPVYVPEGYEVVNTEQATGHSRSKRSVEALPFLIGVAAGGIFGPILYNRLYGNQAVYYEAPRGWAAPVAVGWAGATGGY
jgi:hypothetical protein